MYQHPDIVKAYEDIENDYYLFAHVHAHAHYDQSEQDRNLISLMSMELHCYLVLAQLVQLLHLYITYCMSYIQYLKSYSDSLLKKYFTSISSIFRSYLLFIIISDRGGLCLFITLKSILLEYLYHLISFFPSMILAFIVFYWVVISALAIYTNLNTFKKFSSYQDLTKSKPQWEGIIRRDFKQWNKTKIIIGSFTILPIRFFALSNFLIGALLFSVIISLTKDESTKAKIFKICTRYFNSYGKLMNNIAMRIEDNCPNPEDSRINTPIIISNHNCWFDTYYITLKYSPVSYIAKYQIQFWPVIGPIAKALNCIFVRRQSQADRNTVKQQIQERIKDFNEGKFNAYPLVIYPEGTTSNNRVILNFKLGAFENLSPLTMFCIKYQCQNCELGQDQMQQAECIFISLAQFNRVKVTKIQMKPEPKQTPEQYKDRCRDVMAKTLGFPKVNVGYRDRIQLQKYRKAAKKTQ